MDCFAFIFPSASTQETVEVTATNQTVEEVMDVPIDEADGNGSSCVIA